VSVIAIALTYISPVGELFNFVPLPLAAALVAIALIYVAKTEITKYWSYFAKRHRTQTLRPAVRNSETADGTVPGAD
jgi:hypothetical protein